MKTDTNVLSHILFSSSQKFNLRQFHLVLIMKVLLIKKRVFCKTLGTNVSLIRKLQLKGSYSFILDTSVFSEYFSL